MVSLFQVYTEVPSERILKNSYYLIKLYIMKLYVMKVRGLLFLWTTRCVCVNRTATVAVS